MRALPRIPSIERKSTRVLAGTERKRGSMKQFIGCDVHKKYSVFVSVDETGRASRQRFTWLTRAANWRRCLETLPAGSPVAVETTGHWYWIFDAIENAWLDPRLTHALAAKRMMVSPNKTDKVDARGLATLLLNGSLPEVWAPGAEIRDLMRSRLAMRRIGTSLKNRIGAGFARYGLPENWTGELYGYHTTRRPLASLSGFLCGATHCHTALPNILILFCSLPKICRLVALARIGRALRTLGSDITLQRLLPRQNLSSYLCSEIRYSR